MIDDDRHMPDPLPPPVVADHKALRKLQPIVDDLLSIIALLMTESDAMRIELGHPHIGQVRTFSDHDLARGRTMGPTAKFLDANHLEITLQS